jgi:hypothetical protein
MMFLHRALFGATTAALIGAAALVLSARPASAGHSVATRCDWRGCSHIVCNHTGDRCHRFYGHGYYRRYREPYYGYDGYGYEPSRYGYRGDDDRGYYGGDEGWRYDCDNDADRCYVRRGGYDYDDRY